MNSNLYKFGENVSSYIFHEKYCCDLNLGESLCICTFFLFPGYGLNVLNGFDFLFWSILNGLTLKTSNSQINSIFEERKKFDSRTRFFFCKIVPHWVYFGQDEDFKLTTELSVKVQYSRNQAIKNGLNRAMLLI